MASVQMLKTGGASTFGELAEKHFDLFATHFGRNGHARVDVVFDQYRDISIKSGERARRTVSMGLEIKIKTPTTPLPKQWQKYINNPKNMVNLCEFLCRSWCEMAEKQLLSGQVLILGGGLRNGEITLLVTTGKTYELSSLRSDHEEADTSFARSACCT